VAFPTTSVLSTFDGANEEPLSEGGNWAGPIRAASASLGACRLVSNTVGPSTVGGISTSESYWTPTTFGADQEVFCTVSAAATGTQGFSIWCRLQQEGADTVDGYNLSYTHGTGFRMFRIANAAFSQVGSTNTQAVSTGDAAGLSVIGTSLEMWYKASGGSWTSLGTGTNSDVAGAGKLGISISQATAAVRLDAFGGGEVVAAATTTPKMMLLGVG
jgi:hypothetical protein